MAIWAGFFFAWVNFKRIDYYVTAKLNMNMEQNFHILMSSYQYRSKYIMGYCNVCCSKFQSHNIKRGASEKESLESEEGKNEKKYIYIYIWEEERQKMGRIFFNAMSF